MTNHTACMLGEAGDSSASALLETGRSSEAEPCEWQLYRKMFEIRRVEESLLALHAQGLLFGTVHTCIGQEVCAVGVTEALDPARDVVWSNHRGHGHYLAFTGDTQGLISEISGKAGGVCFGIGGSQHLHRRNFYSNGILGGTVACAVGCAFAEKHKGTGGVVVVFFGDGALAEGIVYESFNIASLWKLPVLFVLEDNGYAQSTPKQFEHAGDIETRATSFRIATTRVPASDPLQVFRTSKSIVDEMRDYPSPRFLVLETYRLAAHSKGDDLRDPAEIARFRAADPLRLCRERLKMEHVDRLEEMERIVTEDIEAQIQTAINDRAMETHRFLAHVVNE